MKKIIGFVLGVLVIGGGYVLFDLSQPSVLEQEVKSTPNMISQEYPNQHDKTAQNNDVGEINGNVSESSELTAESFPENDEDDALTNTTLIGVLHTIGPGKGSVEEYALFSQIVPNHEALLKTKRREALARAQTEDEKGQPISAKEAIDWIETLYQDALLAIYLQSDITPEIKEAISLARKDSALKMSSKNLIVGPHLSPGYLDRLNRLLALQSSPELEKALESSSLVDELSDMTRRRKYISDNYMKKWLRPYLENPDIGVERKIELGESFRSLNDTGLQSVVSSYLRFKLNRGGLEENVADKIKVFLETSSTQ